MSTNAQEAELQERRDAVHPNAGKRWDDIADTYENRGRQLRQLADACTDDANRYRRAAQDAREGVAERLLLERWAELQAKATVSVPQDES